MSQWKNIPKEDIELDDDEINIKIGNDDSGSKYAVVKIEDMKDLLKDKE